MVIFNYANREMTAKIVYYGPGLCGKTTNLEVIHKKMPHEKRGRMVSLATETDRTLFFDLLPVDLGSVGGFHVKIQLFTVPGQTFYNATRKLVLRGVDGIVFVADSQQQQLGANVESMENLKQNLTENHIDLDSIPLVLQYNKQDLSPLSPDDHLNQVINKRGAPVVKAVAVTGQGVFETFKTISKAVIVNLKGKIGRGAPPAAAAARPPRRARADAARIKVKSKKSHVPTHAKASKERIHRELGLAPSDTKSPDTIFELWSDILEGGIPDMGSSETLAIIDGIKKNLAGIIESNKNLNAQYENLFRLLDKLAANINKSK